MPSSSGNVLPTEDRTQSQQNQQQQPYQRRPDTLYSSPPQTQRADGTVNATSTRRRSSHGGDGGGRPRRRRVIPPAPHRQLFLVDPAAAGVGADAVVPRFPQKAGADGWTPTSGSPAGTGAEGDAVFYISPTAMRPKRFPQSTSQPSGASAYSNQGLLPPGGESQGQQQTSKDGKPSKKSKRAHTKRLDRRYLEPVELQVESLSGVLVRVLFIVWYVVFATCIIIEVIPGAQWNIVNLCDPSAPTNLRHLDRWSSPCVTVTTSAEVAPSGAALYDLTWLGGGLDELHDPLKRFRRMVISLPRPSGQTEKTRLFSFAANVSAFELGEPMESTFPVTLQCRRDKTRCDAVRLPEDIVMVDESGMVTVSLIGVPPEIANEVQADPQYSTSVGVAFQRHRYTLATIIWRYVFLLLSLFHLMRFVANKKFTSKLYEQRWIIVLQVSLFWYLDPLFALNIVTEPLPLVLSYVEYRFPTYFLAITLGFMFSVMTASMAWKQRTRAEMRALNPVKRWLLRSRNVYDPPRWTKVVAVAYVVAVFVLDLIDACIDDNDWSSGANSGVNFRKVFWSVIALLLFGGIVCLLLLWYLRNYLGAKPYLESRPQQLACRVFLMVFFLSIVFYIIQCFVFFLYYNRDHDAVASRQPFVQLPSIMIATFFVNIMTLVYTTRSRIDSVPISASDQRWKHVVWPDTWYRWLSRHGGSQYIFFTEGEETNFYKLQYEFRRRQFLAKLKRSRRSRGQSMQTATSPHHADTEKESVPGDLPSWGTSHIMPSAPAAAERPRDAAARGSSPPTAARAGSAEPPSELATASSGDRSGAPSEVGDIVMEQTGTAKANTHRSSPAAAAAGDSAGKPATRPIVIISHKPGSESTAEPPPPPPPPPQPPTERTPKQQPAAEPQHAPADFQTTSQTSPMSGASSGVSDASGGAAPANTLAPAPAVMLHANQREGEAAVLRGGHEETAKGTPVPPIPLKTKATTTEKEEAATTSAQSGLPASQKSPPPPPLPPQQHQQLSPPTPPPLGPSASESFFGAHRNGSMNSATLRRWAAAQEGAPTLHTARGANDDKNRTYNGAGMGFPGASRAILNMDRFSTYFLPNASNDPATAGLPPSTVTVQGGEGTHSRLPSPRLSQPALSRPRSAAPTPGESRARGGGGGGGGARVGGDGGEGEDDLRTMPSTYGDEWVVEGPARHRSRLEQQMVAEAAAAAPGEGEDSEDDAEMRVQRQPTWGGTGTPDARSLSGSLRRPVLTPTPTPPLFGSRRELSRQVTTGGDADDTELMARTFSGVTKRKAADGRTVLWLPETARSRDVSRVHQRSHSAGDAAGGRGGAAIVASTAKPLPLRPFHDGSGGDGKGGATVSYMTTLPTSVGSQPLSQSQSPPPQEGLIGGAATVRPHSVLLLNSASGLGEDAGGTTAVEPLRAYAQYLPELSSSDDVSGSDTDSDSEPFLSRTFNRARGRLGTLITTAEQNLLVRPARSVERWETSLLDVAYRPFQSVAYLPFFNLETAIDCYNMSWEAYGVPVSEGDAAIETGIAVKPENVPKTVAHGVKKVFFGCCPASDESEEDTENEGIAEDAHAEEPVHRVDDDRLSNSRQNDDAGTGRDRTCNENNNNNAHDAEDRSATPGKPTSARVEFRAEEMAPPAVDPAALPINVEKYGYTSVLVAEAKDVQVLMTTMDLTAQEHRGKAPRVIIAFRGTANMSNAKYDANLHRVVWREMEHEDHDLDATMTTGGGSTVGGGYIGCASCMRNCLKKTSWRPTIHAGFLSIWKALKPKVMTRLKQLLDDDNSTVYRVFTTGHSLGGALASLCAYSVSRMLSHMEYPIPDVTVYTYGQPRLGNATFQRMYNRVVPRSFCVVNESDMVVTMTTFGGYHVGIEVDIDRHGNYIVKPTDIEKMFPPTQGRGLAVINHLMMNYGVSLNKIAERTNCPARGLHVYLTASPEKIAAEKEKEELALQQQHQREANLN